MGLRSLVRVYNAAADWTLRQAEAPKTDPITRWALIIVGVLAALETVAQVWILR